MIKRLFTSESVTEGHPDKMCDKISDSVLDAILTEDPMARVACEVTASTGLISIMGEITTTAKVDFQEIARQAVREIGYNSSEVGFDAATCSVSCSIHSQSPDIAMGVDLSLEAKNGEGDGLDHGAGDQGMMFGYACNETPEKMPLPISMAHTLARKLTEVRKSGLIPYLRPDGKTQVTVAYDENDQPIGIETIVVSTQHDDGVELSRIRADIEKHVIRAVVSEEMMLPNMKIFVNPTGRFVIGGPYGDCGLTGRKIIVDTYGGYARHGGGAFSGKDPTKVDRSGAYMARYMAKNVVAAGLADRCEIQLAYAIGVARPVSVMVDCFGTEKIPVQEIHDRLIKTFDMRPSAIIKNLGLRAPIYGQTAAYGHFGRQDVDLPWERTDHIKELQN